MKEKVTKSDTDITRVCVRGAWIAGTCIWSVKELDCETNRCYCYSAILTCKVCGRKAERLSVLVHLPHMNTVYRTRSGKL
jgi:hypothetical protein